MRNLKTARRRADLRAGRTDWYKIRDAAGEDGPAEVFVYDEIGFWGVTAEDMIRDLKEITAPQITLRINSPGGGIFEGIAIMNVLRAHPAHVTTHVDSLAASIASVIAMAGDRIVMEPFSQMMIHDGSGLAIGNAADMREMAELLDRQSDNIAAVYADRTGGTAAEFRALMRAETWFTAQEAVEAGLADEVAPTRRRAGDDDPDMSNTWDLSIFTYAGREFAPPPPIAHLVATASRVHHTDTVDTAWDGPAAVAAMPNDERVLRYCHAWYDADGDPDAKSTYKFPHHKTEGGPANLAACRNGLARLSSADIPDGDRDGVAAHLRAHLHDGDGDGDGEQEDRIRGQATDPAPPGEPQAAAPAAQDQDTPPGEEPGPQPGPQPDDEPADEPEAAAGGDQPDDNPDEEEQEESPEQQDAAPADEWQDATAHLLDPPASGQDDEIATLMEAWK